MEFVVDSVEYSPKDFHEQFSNFLPRLVQVTKGYYGEEQIKTYERGQVLFIRRSGSQERVVASVLQGPLSLTHRLLSIPIDYNAQFCFVSAKKGNKRYNLRRVLSKRRLPIDVIFIPDMTSNDPESFTLMRLISGDERLVLRLTHTYQDTFLLGHNLSQDKVTSAIQQLPLFLTDLRMSLIVGRKGYEPTEWSNYIHSLNDICINQIQCDNYFGNPDIALYAKDDGDFDATVQVPQVYCTLHDCLNETNMYQTITGSKPEKSRSEENCDTYEVIASCARDKPPSCSANTKPKIPPKPQYKSKSMHRSRSADDSAKDGGAPPGIPPRRGSCVTLSDKVKGQISLLGFSKKHYDLGESDLKNVYEDISETSRDNSASTSRLISQSSLSAKSETDLEEVTLSTPMLPPRNINPRGKNIRNKPATADARKDLQKMTIADVGALLQKLKLEQYVSVFEKQWIDGAILSELTADILHSDCGMKKVEAVRLMTYVEKGHIPG